MSSGAQRATKDDRRAALADLQTQQQRADRRRNILIVGISVLVALALIIPAVVVLTGESRRQAAIAEAAAGDIQGVEEYSDLTANHVSEDVTYDAASPVGGDHNPAWQNCGFYEEPVVEEHAVHSLEHGAVWVTFDPELPQAQVDTLRELADQHPYLLVSPREDIEAPVVASAWGIQLQLEDVDDERLEIFLLKYLQGPQTLEPGASCSGSVGA